MIPHSPYYKNRASFKFVFFFFLFCFFLSPGTGSFDAKVLASMSTTERQRQVKLRYHNTILIYCLQERMKLPAFIFAVVFFAVIQLLFQLAFTLYMLFSCYFSVLFVQLKDL